MLTNIADILLIIAGFGVLIFVHELGHFVAAKWAGIRAEAFAIGMGPVALAWRKGIGVRGGSTVAAYHKLAHDELVNRDTAPQGRNEKGEPVFTQRQLYETADRLGLGETEYSLRWLPLGGFVKMLGQEDLNPNKTSDDPRSYNSCPVGKRMIVVSAGVIMNIIFAALLFIIAFSVGVKFEAPVIGGALPDMPAAMAVATNAEELGVTSPGLKPGDRVTEIDGGKVSTFADVQIATAMGRDDRALRFTVQRSGVTEPLHFVMTPVKDDASGLLGIGVMPASATTLLSKASMEKSDINRYFELTDLAQSGVQPGMTLLTAGGETVSTFQQFEDTVDESHGRPVPTTWATLDENDKPVGEVVTAAVPVQPQLQQLNAPQSNPESVSDYEFGLLGLVPLVELHGIEQDNPNSGVIKNGDVVLAVGKVHGPQDGVFRQYIQDHAGQDIALTVLRDGRPVDVMVHVSAKGKLDVIPQYALDTLYIAQPMNRIRILKTSDRDERVVATPIEPLTLLPTALITQVGDTAVQSWRDMRDALTAQTAGAQAANEGATIHLTIIEPTPGHETDVYDVALSAEDVQKLHELSWQTMVSALLFEPLYATRTAGGNPLKAVAMGVEETKKAMVLTYLTIDRLIRGTVGVEQLRGPIGIVHMGSVIATKGFMYVLFFLALISVNLAVINFLPLPIVDGGLFLFLVYEKIKGHPPSAAFQQFATVAGLFLIATAFLVVTWNDVMRLIQ